MAEGRTDPQRRWTLRVCPQCGGWQRGSKGVCSCVGAVEEVEVVPADDRLTAEEASMVLDGLAWPTTPTENAVSTLALRAKLRRVAGREDSK